MTQQIPWGNTLLVLDNAAFQKGYALGRSFYFHGSPHACNAMLLTSDLLRVVALEDEDGHFCLDEDTCIETDLENLLGWLAGYLSGPLHPETCEELQVWANSLPDITKSCILCHKTYSAL